MVKKSILNKLFLYNMHIGHNYLFNSTLSEYIYGKRYGYIIIDLNKSFFFLRKALLFIESLSRLNGSLLFFHTNYTNLELIHQCALLSIVKSINQPIITHDWIYGSISNYFFSFFQLLSEIINTWFLNSNYYMDLKNSHSRFFKGNYEEEYLYIFLNTYYKNSLNRHNDSAAQAYKPWYNKWLNNQALYKNTKSKSYLFSKTKLLKQLCYNDLYTLLKKKQLWNFKAMFLKFFYYVNKKTVNIKKVSNIIYSRLVSFWRVLLYFKYFKNLFRLPDALFLVYPDNNITGLKEFSKSNLVTMGLVDSNNDVNHLTYPIISNDDSIVIIFFYYNLICNTFLTNQLYLYKQINL